MADSTKLPIAALSGSRVSDSGNSGPNDYLFIDNARFICMIAIVMRHCELSLFRDYNVSALESAIAQIRTFGVLLFFVNSAFLMASWLERPSSSVRAYWQNRLRRVGIPWLIWVGVYELLGLAKFYFASQGGHLEEVPHQLWKALFRDNYWFVPILFFSLAIMLPLHRFWKSLRFGLLLFLLSSFYGVNQYVEWIPPSHTTAVFGYLFYLWMGVQLYENFAEVQEFVRRIPWWVALLSLCLAIGLMLVEDQISVSVGFPNYYNALQNSNQVYALAVLVVLLKIPVKLAPSFIDVRRDSYGIYLLHQIVGSVCRGIIDLAAGGPESGKSFFTKLPETVENPFARIGIWVLWFGVLYCTSLLLTKFIRRTSWAWTVGEKR